MKGASPSAPSFAAAVKFVPQNQDASIETTAASKKVIIGPSTSATLKASKNLWVKKSVYCLGNIDSNYTEANVKEFVESLGVRVATCNLLKHVMNQPSDNNRCRIAIFSDDNDQLLNARNWSVGISIRKWVFKPKDDANAHKDVIDITASSVIPNEMIVDEAESSSNQKT